MAQVVALTQIVRTVKPGVAADKAKGVKAIPPQSKTIEPGTLFVSDGDELATLREARAVRDPEPGEFGVKKIDIFEADPAPKAAPAKTGKAAGGSAKGKAAPAAKNDGTAGGEGDAGDGGAGDAGDGSNLV